MGDFLRRDLPVLFIVSIIIGTLAARLISFAADVYFRETVTGMVGEYGEYDLLLQLREENRSEALAELERILASEFSGAEYKEGPALVQKLNFFVALPAEYKNRELYENIDKRFSSIPGGAGISIITEPRLIIRGLPPGVMEKLRERFAALDGVAFVYGSGSSLGLVINDSRKMQAVSDKAEAALNEAKLLEVSFARGLEPANPKLAAERIVWLLANQAGVMAEYVSQDKESDDFSRLLGVLQEMHSFLQAYRTKLFIKTDTELVSGDLLALPTKGRPQPESGGELAGQAVAKVEYLKRAGLYQAVLLKGDSSELTAGLAHRLDGEQVGIAVGEISWHNPRSALTSAAEEAAGVVSNVPELRVFSRSISKEAALLFDRYEKNQPLLHRTLANMNAAEVVLANSADKLRLLSAAPVAQQLDNSLTALNNLTKRLRYISWLSSDAALALDNIRAVQQKLTALRDILGGAAALGQESQRAGQLLGLMQADIAEFNELLGNFQQAELAASLNSLEQAAGSFDETKSQAVIEALQLLQSNLPLLRDDDIAASVQVIDKLLSGQAPADKRLQFKVARNVDKESLRPVIAVALNNAEFNLFEAELGITEPNIYAQAFQILSEVHAVLAALTAVAVTLVFLALDHTAVAASLSWRWQLRSARRFKLGSLYCAGAGALLLTAIYYLSGAAIPYLPLTAVFMSGAVLGLLFGLLAEKFSPLDTDELLAAESLGLDFTAVMREIVIPAARPGLLSRLNRLRQKFKQR